MFDPANPEPTLVAALRQLPTGSLYSLGDKKQLMEALELCRKSAVRPPQWDRGRSVLAVEVFGENVREVTLTLEDGRLAAECDCPAASKPTCKHRLAVLLTLKKALAPAAVSGWAPAEKELAAISAALVEPVSTRPPERKSGKKPVAARPAESFAVVIEERHGILFIEVMRHGVPARPFDRDLPGALRPLVAGSSFGYTTHAGFGVRAAAFLSSLLDQGSFPWPVFFAAEGNRLPLAVAPPEPHGGRLRFDARQEGVLASRILDDGSLLGERLLWIGGWVADMDGRRLLCLQPPEVWNLWNELTETGTPSRPGEYLIRWADFPGMEVITDPGEAPPFDDFLLLREGKEEQLPAPKPMAAYCLEVEPGQEEAVRLLACVRLGDQTLLLDRRALALFAEDLYSQTSAPLRAFKRRRALYEGFFAARRATTRTGRRQALREILQTPDFRKRSVAREARAILEQALLFEGRATWVLIHAEEGWQLLLRDRAREAALLEILYRHFGEPAFRDGESPGMIEAPRHSFFSRLPELLADLQQAGVELRFAGLPAVPAALEIDIEAGGGAIDWFELCPEIRCEGDLLASEMWLRALQEGVLQVGGKLRLLDARSRQALAILADLAGTAPKGRREVMRLPRLHILDLLALRRLGAKLQLAAEDARILDTLESFEAIPECPEPQLSATLRDYQRLGYRWLAFLYANKFGACLADDMGLGKTIQAISLLAALQQGQIASRAPGGTPHLVVMPPSLLFNWESELARFAPQLRTLLYRGQDRRAEFAAVDVVLTSYDLVRRDIAQLAEIPFHVVIFDEAQAVKNVHAAVTGAVRRLQGTFKVALTGTPVENHLGEYWSIIDLVLPGLLGEYRRFSGRRTEAAPEFLQRLIARTRPFLLRRTKEKIAAELPDKVEMNLHLELTAAQKVLYEQTVAQVRREVAAAWREQTAAQARITALSALMRLRRLCLDPRLVGGGDEAASPKIEALCEHLSELLDEGHSVLVFSQFTSFLDLVEPALVENGISFLRLDGGTPVGERKNLVQSFQGSGTPLVFLLSLKAGGRGLNLTRATYVIHLDPWWNPAVENQASDRAHRIGQTRKVTVLRLLMRHTVEEKMMLLKERKECLYRALLEDGRDGGGTPLTREDFEFLVGGEPA